MLLIRGAVRAGHDNGRVISYLSPMAMSEEEAWRQQCRRGLERDVEARIKYGFCHVHKPVLDDCNRAFATMADYREWCERELPEYLGYRRAADFHESSS